MARFPGLHNLSLDYCGNGLSVTRTGHQECSELLLTGLNVEPLCVDWDQHSSTMPIHHVMISYHII